MAIVRCRNGHYYDDSKYAECPHCGVNIGDGGQRVKTTKNDYIREQHTVAKASVNTPVSGREPIRDELTQMHMGQDGSKTVGYYSGRIGIDPVVGWLVCTKGPEKGRDYRLHVGRNHIGRSAKMEVCIVEDEQISRKNHASIIYEPRKSTFILAGGESGSVAINGVLVTQSKTLTDNDTISIGVSEFVFIAYCKGETKW